MRASAAFAGGRCLARRRRHAWTRAGAAGAAPFSEGNAAGCTGRRRRGAAAERRRDDGAELLQVHGLGRVVVGPARARLDRVRAADRRP